MPIAKPARRRIAAIAQTLSWRHWRRRWNQSLRFRWLALGLMPLLVVFPIIILVLGTLGGNRADALLMSSARGQLAGSHNYLEQLKTDTGVRMAQIVKSERLAHLLTSRTGGKELQQVLETSAQASGLDFLIAANADGTVIASSTGVAPGTRLPDSHAITQAVVGVDEFGLRSVHRRAAGLALAPVSTAGPHRDAGSPGRHRSRRNTRTDHHRRRPLPVDREPPGRDSGGGHPDEQQCAAD
ncbi:MAG: hypothetical protein RBS27_16560 [Giesbergeria sp.]|jgi:hypothetical protein|nr:hypothetical protein [Giesbergeria sp.]